MVIPDLEPLSPGFVPAHRGGQASSVACARVTESFKQPSIRGTMSVLLQSGGSADAFFDDTSCSLKAILFTKKQETPGLWLRLADALGEQCKFGEVRHSETEIMDQFGVSPDTLPRILALARQPGGGECTLAYEGPTDFERIGEFLRDCANGGFGLIEARRAVFLRTMSRLTLAFIRYFPCFSVESCTTPGARTAGHISSRAQGAPCRVGTGARSPQKLESGNRPLATRTGPLH
jgi:hypothetical protein